MAIIRALSIESIVKQFSFNVLTFTSWYANLFEYVKLKLNKSGQFIVVWAHVIFIYRTSSWPHWYYTIQTTNNGLPKCKQNNFVIEQKDGKRKK